MGDKVEKLKDAYEAELKVLEAEVEWVQDIISNLEILIDELEG